MFILRYSSITVVIPSCTITPFENNKVIFEFHNVIQMAILQFLSRLRSIMCILLSPFHLDQEGFLNDPANKSSMIRRNAAHGNFICIN